MCLICNECVKEYSDKLYWETFWRDLRRGTLKCEFKKNESCIIVDEVSHDELKWSNICYRCFRHPARRILKSWCHVVNECTDETDTTETRSWLEDTGWITGQKTGVSCVQVTCFLQRISTMSLLRKQEVALLGKSRLCQQCCLLCSEDNLRQKFALLNPHRL